MSGIPTFYASKFYSPRTINQLQATQHRIPFVHRDIPDKVNELTANFRNEWNRFNADTLSGISLSEKEFERIMLEVDGKSVYQSARILRDKLLLTLNDGSSIYLELFDPRNQDRNHYQITDQVTVKNKYTNR